MSPSRTYAGFHMKTIIEYQVEVGVINRVTNAVDHYCPVPFRLIVDHVEQAVSLERMYRDCRGSESWQRQELTGTAGSIAFMALGPALLKTRADEVLANEDRVLRFG